MSVTLDDGREVEVFTLVLEDKPARKELLRRALESRGWEVSVVEGEDLESIRGEAENILESGARFDAVFLDIVYDVEERGGIELFNELESRYDVAALGVLVVYSVANWDEDVATFIEAHEAEAGSIMTTENREELIERVWERIRPAVEKRKKR